MNPWTWAGLTFPDLVALFRDIGFPAGVAIFVLVRLERRLKDLTDAVTELRVCIRLQGEGDSRYPPYRKP